MRKRFVKMLCVCICVFFVADCAVSQESGSTKRQQNRQERRANRQESGVGAGVVAGAAVGLALGAVTGDADIARAGAAAGAASGGVYMYDQSREDRRTKMIADSVSGSQKGQSSPAEGTQQSQSASKTEAPRGETADDAGKRHLHDFVGDWGLSIWALNADGSKITGTAKAKIALTGKEVIQIDFSDIKSEVLDKEVTASGVVTYSASSGFQLESKNSLLPDDRRFVGEYLADKNAYNFYPTNSKEETGATGIIRSNIRVELRVSSGSLFVVETYTMKDGAEVKIQSYRFTK